MPRVPVAENSVGFARVTDRKIDAPNMGAGGEMVGRALQGVGGAIRDAADAWETIKAAQDTAATKEAANYVDSQALGLLHTGEQPYFETVGKDALQNRVDVEQRLDGIIEQGRKQLKTPRQLEMFNERVAQQRLTWGAKIAEHAHTQAFKYDDTETAAGIDLAGQSASANRLDPVESRKHIDNGIGLIAHRGALNGWSPDAVKVETLKFTNAVHNDVGSSLAYEGGVDGPKLAEAYAERHRAEMTADGYQSVLTHARTQQNHLDVEQRRIEAEARREEAEAKREAKDAAQSVYRNIQDGVVVSPKDLATAIDNARAAGDDALVEGLRQGGMKNNLTQQWAGAPPSEIQNRINALSVKITRAGGKVDSDLIVERDHLQTLATNSRSELKADALAWGAKHLGVSVPPLNLNDPKSIAERVKAATTIAARTGTEPQVLTQDEVAASQRTIHYGTTQEKVALALRLGRLGDLAMSAAEQLGDVAMSPNEQLGDSGFVNLIGLASHPNRGVAASRVNQIVTGYDVLKTKPKLIDKAAANSEFNQLVGDAFHFLPQGKAGVLDNAYAMLASRANERGWNEWTDIDENAWHRAINSALGAYVKDGKLLGGLAVYNEATTVLPDNMDQEEFEERISRSHGPQFRAAQNGVPVYGDGRSPTASDLKRMAWVPAGDDVYRLSDGHGFLHTKQGGFYEINIRNLRR